MSIHALKCHPAYFQMQMRGTKNFEIRKHDRDFKFGDEIILVEWDNGKQTGARLDLVIDFVLATYEGLSEGYVILSTSKKQEQTE